MGRVFLLATIKRGNLRQTKKSDSQRTNVRENPTSKLNVKFTVLFGFINLRSYHT